MPKIEVNERVFFDLVGRRWENRQLFEEALTCAKAELEQDSDQSLAEEDRLLKIELNDTNRPDLWSTPGCARQLRAYVNGGIKAYPFFKQPLSEQSNTQYRVIVDKKLQEIRPYIGAFIIRGKALDETILKDFIQTQEKLCWNFGQKRRSIAMGIYRTALIRWPVHYEAADPDTSCFVPLGMEERLSLREICLKHPKGQEFGYIVSSNQRFPYITDNDGATLSFPPVINSARIGAVEVGDSDLFVEMTGTELESLALTINIVACDAFDLGFEVVPVQVEYPYDTPLGKTIVFPFYFQKPTFCSLARIERFLGIKVNGEDCINALKKMGCQAELKHSQERADSESQAGVLLHPPEYRNDFLHAADVAEDVMIGLSMQHFLPLHPSDYTIGRLLPITIFSRQVKAIMVGMGYQEMIYTYLGSRRDFIDRMSSSGETIVKIANPMTEGYEYIRDSILPCLLMSESVSANAVYPHRIFELGKVLVKDSTENYGTQTKQCLSFLHSATDASFNSIASQLQALMYYLSRDYSVVEMEDSRFIPGRAAMVIHESKPVGFFGELHPQVLTNWGITVPCAAAEINLDALISDR